MKVSEKSHIVQESMVGLPPDLPAGWRSSEIGAILGSLSGRTQAHPGSIIAFWAAWDVCDTRRQRQLPPRGARWSGMASGTSLAALSARSILLQKNTTPWQIKKERSYIVWHELSVGSQASLFKDDIQFFGILKTKQIRWRFVFTTHFWIFFGNCRRTFRHFWKTIEFSII